MHQIKKFSIITICRNEAAAIRATCDSICAQCFDEFEWIVIDGGSTDETLKILKDYEDKISCLVSESDQGIYDAMNKGLELARGESVIFMNAGDCFADDKALACVDALPSADLLVGNLVLRESGKLCEFPDTLPPDYLLHCMLPHQATFFKRRLFDKFGLFDTSFRIAGDYEMFARLFHSGELHYYHVNETIAVFAGGGISSDQKQRSLRRRENHKVRWQYFPRYRYSFKALRQNIRIFFKI